MTNRAEVKEMFQRAESAWKEKRFSEAGPLYYSVVGATVPGSEDDVEKARGKIIELEDMARTRLKAADDADLKRDYVREVEELGFVLRELHLTDSSAVAARRLTALKSKPEIAGLVEFTEGEGIESQGCLSEAVAKYQSIVNNSRYDNSLAQLKARRKLDALNENEESRARLQTEFHAKADREAPMLLAAAKNYFSNQKPNEAREKLQAVLDRFPGTKYAEDAQKQLSELK
jgi:hypothetical protein